MLKQNSYFKYLLKLTILLLGMYMLCRILFVIFNVNNLHDITFNEYITLFSQGVRFDLATIIMINIFFYVGWLLPLKLREHPIYFNILKWLFIVLNSIALASNCVDLVYFKYTNKRITADIFSYITTGNDFFRLLPLFLIQFWYLLLLFILFVYLIIRIVSKLTPDRNETNNKKYYFNHIGLFLILIGPLIIGFRGGLQKKPISIFSAGEYTSSDKTPIITNTPFCLIKSIEGGVLDEKKYFDEKAITSLIKDTYHYSHLTPNNKNVVLLILESFSKEYIGYLSHAKTYTPFLDSLMQQGICFTNTFANGKRSIEGIPAITASIPTLMDQGYITSTYGTNKINSIAESLTQINYHSVFFHGGENGSMGFDLFSKISGYNKYYGKNEYPLQNHDDGNWGIWDEEYLKYTIDEMNKLKEPFFSTIFTLSSHHPYNVPDKYVNIFVEEELPIHKSIRYSDHALRLFFNEVKKTSWYNNTIFVLVADHTGISAHPYYANQVGLYTIPLLFFNPKNTTSKIETKLAQQLDIYPSLMYLLGYNKPFYSLGNNLFDSLPNKYVVKYSSPNYEMITDSMFYVFDGEKLQGIFNRKKDSLLQNNLKYKVHNDVDERYLKSFIQNYNHVMISNTMQIDKN